MKLKHPILALLSISILLSCSQRPVVPGNDHSVQVSKNKSNSSARPAIPNGATTVPPVRQASNTSSRPQIGNTAVFMIFTSSGYEQFQGSGFFINSSGLAVSNYHVFEGTTIGYEVIKLQDGRQYKLKDIIFKDKTNDIIMFTIDAESTSFKCLPLSTRQPRVGDKAYAIGSPRGLENTFSSGEISQLREDNIIQISVPIDHGSSGGALINEYGEAIGITSAGLDDSGANLNFAVSTDLVRRHLR